MNTDFFQFPKMARLSREMLLTEKIDGTNAQILIAESDDTTSCIDSWTDGEKQFVMLAGSRTRWITPEQDNFGFARWAKDHAVELRQLGVGRHFGEWWGQGIQRNYGLKERRWSLFNVSRWCLHGAEPQQIPSADPRIIKMQDVLPSCCGLVPLLYRGIFSTASIDACLHDLATHGSKAAPSFLDPEGIVAFHISGNVGFKQTLKDDGVPKSLSKHSQ